MPRDHMPQGAGQRAVRGHQQRQMRNRSEQGLRLDPYIQSIKRTRPPGPHAPISEAAKSPGRAKPGKILYKKQLGVGYWVLGIRYWVLGIGYWVLGWILIMSLRGAIVTRNLGGKISHCRSK